MSLSIQPPVPTPAPARPDPSTSRREGSAGAARAPLDLPGGRELLRAGRSAAIAVLLACLGFSDRSLAQGSLAPGGAGTGTLAPVGEADSWTFTVEAGASIFLRVGATSFTPKLRLFGPDNASIAESTPGNTLNRDGILLAQAVAAGSYSVLVSAAYAGQTGPYRICVAAAPGPVTVPAGDEGGPISSGARQLGELELGDVDVWTFEARAGDGLGLRGGGNGLTPWIRVHGPSGTLLAESAPPNTLSRDIALNLQAPADGIYTVVLSAFYAGQSGPYGLHLARAPGQIAVAPGDEGGPLANGAVHPGTFEIGDLDVWSFAAGAGDGLMIRMGATGLTPWLRLYGPDGALAAETTSGNSLARDGVLTLSATNAGTYYLVASAAYAGQSGTYNLHLARSPGEFVVSPADDGGPLGNGTVHRGTLEPGDLDLWSFDASAGDALMIRMGATGLTPWLRLYAPNGMLAAETISGNTLARDGSLTLSATNSGTYHLVASAAYAGQAGTYLLNLARAPGTVGVSPGDEGGPLTNGGAHPGTLPVGDLDVWTFQANAGDSLQVRMGAAGLTPWIRLYGPDGGLVDSTASGNTLARDGDLVTRATNAGPHTLVVSAAYAGQTGDYTLNFLRLPEPFGVTPGDEGGPLTNGVTHSATLSLGDIDVWSFIGTPGDSNVLRVVATSFTPWIRLYGPDGALARETTSGNTLARAGSLTYPVTNAGLYTVVVAATYAGQSGTYTFRPSRVPPDLLVPETTFLDEGGTLSVPISAQDPDEPGKPLTFALLAAPPGLTLTLAGPTNAILAWTTTEAIGPATNQVVATVTDVVNGRPFVRTNQFTVVVREINSPPSLDVPSDRTVDELTPLAASATATDIDLPVNPIAYRLVDPPAGMTIDTATGEIHWTPSEDQGPGTRTIAVVATDQNPWAAHAQSLGTTNQFTVTVREINLPPVLTVPADQIIDELGNLAANASATDGDLPPNPLTFHLASAPAGMAIDPATGLILWQPSEAQGPSTNPVVVVVSDLNPAAANTSRFGVTNTFLVVVREVNQAPNLPVQVDRSIAELATLTVTNAATDGDLPLQVLTYTLLQPPAGAAISPAGVITWTPTEAGGPATNRFTTVVQDNGSPALSATNTFTVIVTELNATPVLTVPADQTVAELSPLAVTVSATDPDLPANRLTFRLLSPPEGLTINPESGAITWTPAEAQGPSSPVITVVVTDANPDAGASGSLSVTNSFRITVTEQNTPPVLPPVADASVHYGSPLRMAILGGDGDLPANALAYSLDQAPAGMVIEAATGTLAWTPAQSQIGSHTVTVRLSDAGDPPLAATRSFQVIVFGAGSRLAIRPLAGGLMQVESTGEPGLDYELQSTTDLVTWTRLVEFRLSGSTQLYIDPASPAAPVRFYRLQLRQQ